MTNKLKEKYDAVKDTALLNDMLRQMRDDMQNVLTTKEIKKNVQAIKDVLIGRC